MARERFSPVSQCNGKAQFQSRRQAENVARRMHSKDRKVAAYFCSHCNHWHVGGGRE